MIDFTNIWICLGCILVPFVVLWVYVSDKEWKEQEARAAEAREKAAEAREKKAREAMEFKWREIAIEGEKLRMIPTSTTNRIVGKRIVAQVKMIHVDGYLTLEPTGYQELRAETNEGAEIGFLRQVAECGGNGVINMSIRRHAGGYVSIQGDAVKLE